MKRLLAVLGAALIFTLFVRPADAQADVTIIRNELRVDYPETVTFTLEFEPAGTAITSAVLTYETVKTSCVPVAVSIPVELDGATLDWTWVLNRSGNPPPGAELRWHWTLTDTGGRVTTTPEQRFVFTDDRFRWRTVTAPGITLNWYEGDDVGPTLLQAAAAGLEQLESDMGIKLQEDVTFYIYGSAGDMREALLYVQEWAGGLAFSEYNIILMGVSPESANDWGVSTVRHELAHLVVGQFGRSCVGGRRPNWLNEGLAVYAEGVVDESTLADIERGVQDDAFLPLRSLNGAFPTQDDDVRLAYSQSYSVVDYLITTYGQESLRELLLTLADGRGFDEALVTTYGLNTDALETAWRAWLGAPARTPLPTPTPLSADQVATVVPLRGPVDVPTPPAGDDTPVRTGRCAGGLLPLLALLPARRRPIRKLKRWRFVPFYLMLLPLLPGCRFVNRDGSELARELQLNPAATLTLAGSQPLTLDPALTRSGPAGAVGHIFNGLVILNTDLQVEPALAGGWEVSRGGTVYTFFIRDGARFHDGRPVTAADVAASWERATDPALGSDTAATYLGDIVGVTERLSGESSTISGLRVLDEKRLEVTIDAPKIYFLAKLTMPAAYVIDPENVREPDWEYAPNGTGPFYLERWRDDEALLLTRFDAYWDPARIKHVLYVIGRGIPLAMYENDQIDLVGIGGSTIARALDPNDPLSRDLRQSISFCTTTIGFDARRPPFDDVRARQAFSYALDRDKLTAGLFQDRVFPAAGPLPPGMPAYTGLENADVPGYRFDAARARELLAAAGYAEPADFPPITFSTAGYDDVSGLVTAAITMWEETLGIEITVALIEPFSYLDALYAGDIGHLYSGSWCADYPDPENFLDALYHSSARANIGGYRNLEVDSLLERARVEPDIHTRLRLYEQIEAMIAADAPVVFVNHPVSTLLIKPRVQNYVLTPIGVAQWHRISLSS